MKKYALLMVVVLLGSVSVGECSYGTYDPLGQVIRLGTGQILTPGSPGYSYLRQKWMGEGLITELVVPGKVAVEGSVGKVSKWANLAIGKTPASVITRVAIEGGLLVGTLYLGPWLAEHAMQWMNGEVVVQQGSGGYVASQYATGIGALSGKTSGNYDWDITFVPWGTPYGTYPAAWSRSIPCWDCDYRMRDIYGWDIEKWVFSCTGVIGNPTYKFTGCMAKPKYSANANYVEEGSEYVAVSSEDLQDTLEGDLVEPDSSAWYLSEDAIKAIEAGVNNANAAWPGQVPAADGYTGLSTSQGADVQQALNDSVPDQVKDDLMDDANSTDANYPEVFLDWEYTPEQMAAAQKVKDLEREAAWVTDWTANKPADGNGSSIDSGSYTLPERRDLPGVLTTFKNAVGSLPLVSWANGFHVTVTGASSMMTLPLPAGMGGPINVDFADYEGVLDTMGNGLYALVGIASVLFLFRGRGD